MCLIFNDNMRVALLLGCLAAIQAMVCPPNFQCLSSGITECKPQTFSPQGWSRCCPTAFHCKPGYAQGHDCTCVRAACADADQGLVVDDTAPGQYRFRCLKACSGCPYGMLLDRATCGCIRHADLCPAGEGLWMDAPGLYQCRPLGCSGFHACDTI